MAATTNSQANARTNLEAMAAVLRGYVTVGGADAVASGELLAEHCVYEDWGSEPITGRDAIVRQVLDPYRSSFAGQHHLLNETIVDSTRLVVLAEFRGRFVEEYMGVEPTGGEVSWAVRDVWTFRDGEVVRIDIAGDTERVAEQMGIDKASG